MISNAVKTAVTAFVLLLPAAAAAQTYKTAKYNIGGEGGTDYLNADPATGRVFISRSTHVMVVDGATGKVVGDILDTPRIHGIAFAQKENLGFTTNAGDSTLTMFDLKSLASPRVPLGLVTARQDKWLQPRYHSDPVLQACAKCERVADFANGGHGALLSPAPPDLTGLLGELINDPPGFDRATEVPEANRRIVAFFGRHLPKP